MIGAARLLMLHLIAENGQGELQRQETGEDVQAGRDRVVREINPIDDRRMHLRRRQRNKNFRQPLARTLEPGTLPEIFVDVERYPQSDAFRPSDRCYGVVSGPAQRIR